MLPLCLLYKGLRVVMWVKDNTSNNILTGFVISFSKEMIIFGPMKAVRMIKYLWSITLGVPGVLPGS